MTAEEVKKLAGMYARAMTRTNLISERECKGEMELELDSPEWRSAIAYQESIRTKLHEAIEALAKGKPLAEA